MSVLVAVFECYGVLLNPARTTQLSICPLDHEVHPSCSVSLGDKGLWRCHSCGEGGDAITLIRLKEDCDFLSAKRKLVDIVGDSDSPLPAPRRGRGGVAGKPGIYRPKFRRHLAPGGGA